MINKTCSQGEDGAGFISTEKNDGRHPESKLPQQFYEKCQRIRSVNAEMVNLDIFIPATVVRRLSCTV